MSSACRVDLLTCLSQTADPRGRGALCWRRPDDDMLTASCSALLCGNRGYAAIAESLHDLPVDVWQWMGYPRRPQIPTPGDFSRRTYVLTAPRRRGNLSFEECRTQSVHFARRGAAALDNRAGNQSGATAECGTVKHSNVC